jgi:hypothetical protein
MDNDKEKLQLVGQGERGAVVLSPRERRMLIVWRKLCDDAQDLFLDTWVIMLRDHPNEYPSRWRGDKRTSSLRLVHGSAK